MIRKWMSAIVVKLLKQFFRKLNRMGVIEIPQPNNIKGINIDLADNCFIQPSAILKTGNKGKILLHGSNYIGRDALLETDSHIIIGYGSSIQDRNIVLGDIEIGKFCLLAPNVYLSSTIHHFDHQPDYYIKDQDRMVSEDESLSKNASRKVIIEDDVWIGINAVIMSGITIGRGSVIGANSVVTKNVEPFSVMGGVPAKLIKKRLNFAPKSILKFDNDYDLPNFYKGFFGDLKNLEQDRKQGGIAASGSFMVFMENEGLKIQLTIKGLGRKGISLAYNHQVIKTDENEYSTIVFDKLNENYHHFLIENEDANANEKLVLIKEVKVLNK